MPKPSLENLEKYQMVSKDNEHMNFLPSTLSIANMSYYEIRDAVPQLKRIPLSLLESVTDRLIDSWDYHYHQPESDEENIDIEQDPKYQEVENWIIQASGFAHNQPENNVTDEERQHMSSYIL